MTLGSLDEPARAKPSKQHGIESRVPWWRELSELPELSTEQDPPPGGLGNMKNLPAPERRPLIDPARATLGNDAQVGLGRRGPPDASMTQNIPELRSQAEHCSPREVGSSRGHRAEGHPGRRGPRLPLRGDPGARHFRRRRRVLTRTGARLELNRMLTMAAQP